jgi:hypothetical protein
MISEKLINNYSKNSSRQQSKFVETYIKFSLMYSNYNLYQAGHRWIIKLQFIAEGMCFTLLIKSFVA